MFIIRLRKARISIAKNKLQKFVKIHCYSWLEKKRQEKRKIIYGTLYF